MRDSLAEAQHYKERAEHLRTLAAQDENMQTRDALLGVARDYDRLAAKLLSLAKQNRPPSPSGYNPGWLKIDTGLGRHGR